MKPILFDVNEKNFTTSGLGRLSDAISCTVKGVKCSGDIFLYLKRGNIHHGKRRQVGLPIPKKLRDVLAQLHTKEGKNEKETDK